MAKIRYSEDTQWADITPILQDDGGSEALAVIAYTDEYREATSYLRAVMANDEHSARVLALTAHIITLNPAHYTVWLYRAKTLLAMHAHAHHSEGPVGTTPAPSSSSSEGVQLTTELEAALRAEIEWLNGISLRFIKNYQIWHHRQMLLTLLRDPSGEADFLTEMLDKDAKNYHVWSYRQWMTGHFGLCNDVKEWDEVERRLRWDVRNNSAWNHRWFLVFGHAGRNSSNDSATSGDEASSVISGPKWQRELEYAQDKIRLAPQNESPWNYLKGLLRQKKQLEDPSVTITTTIKMVQEFAEEFAPVDNPDAVCSSHALDFLVDVYLEQSDAKRAVQALEMLAERFDPIRARYWRYRKRTIFNSIATNSTYTSTGGGNGGDGAASTTYPVAAVASSSS